MDTTCNNCIYWEGMSCLNPISPWWKEWVTEDDSCSEWEGANNDN